MAFESDPASPKVLMSEELMQALQAARSFLDAENSDAATDELRRADCLIVRAIREGFHIVVSVDAAAYDAAVSAEWDSVPERDLSEEGHRVFRCDSSILGRHTRVVGDPPVVGTQRDVALLSKYFPRVRV